jgi:hypothetical protein
MRLLKERVFWGVLLVVVGGLLMLQALGVLAGAGVTWTVLEFVWPVALLIGGLYLILRAFGLRGGSGRRA